MINLDGTEYRVYVIHPSRVLSFEIVEGNNSGQSLSFREIRDIGGTRYNYTMKVQPGDQRPGGISHGVHALRAGDHGV